MPHSAVRCSSWLSSTGDSHITTLSNALYAAMRADGGHEQASRVLRVLQGDSVHQVNYNKQIAHLAATSWARDTANRLAV